MPCLTGRGAKVSQAGRQAGRGVSHVGSVASERHSLTAVPLEGPPVQKEDPAALVVAVSPLRRYQPLRAAADPAEAILRVDCLHPEFGRP